MLVPVLSRTLECALSFDFSLSSLMLSSDFMSEIALVFVSKYRHCILCSVGVIKPIWICQTSDVC